MIESVPRRRFGLVLTIVATAVVLCGLQAAFARAAQVAVIPSSSISGRVTDKLTGDPVAGVDVGILSAGERIAGSLTDSSGYYDVQVLAAGTYRVMFEDGSGYYAFQYYKGKTTLSASTPVVVKAGSRVGGINAALVEGAFVTGQVTDKVSGDPISHVSVDALWPSGARICGVFTDSSGYYDLGGLAGGTYRIRFQDTSGYYAFQYYKGKTTLGASSAVTVKNGAELSGINAALVDAAHVTGRVTDRVTGEPIRGINVGALWPSGDRICGAFSDSSGYYDLGGLAAGSYRVVFDDNSGYYARQYFDQKPRFSFANAVTLAAGADRTGVDAAMVALESEPPLTVDDAPAEWQTSGVSVTLTASDGGSGVFGTFYKINGGTTRNYSSPIRVSAQGLTTIEYWSIDRAGNIEGRHTASVIVFSRPSGRGAPSQPSTPPSVTHGVPFTTLGAVVRHSAGSYPVTLQFYRYQSGHWVLRKSVDAKVADVLTFSKYWRTTSVAYSGKWRVRAKHKVGHTNLYSDYRYFTAK